MNLKCNRNLSTVIYLTLAAAESFRCAFLKRTRHTTTAPKTARNALLRNAMSSARVSLGQHFDTKTRVGATNNRKPGKKDRVPRIHARKRRFTRKNLPVKQYFKKWIPIPNAPSVSSHMIPVPSIAVQNETFGFLKSSDAILAYPEATIPASTANVPKRPARTRLHIAFRLSSPEYSTPQVHRLADDAENRRWRSKHRE
jgi:hypothetical protein